LIRCADYFDLVEGRATVAGEAEALFADCPPGRLANEKIVLGVFDGQDRLVGVLDAIPDHPLPGTWFIGLLLLDPARRGGGLGRRVYQAFERWAAASGARRIELGVVEANAGAVRFWERLDFQRVERRSPRRFGLREHIVDVWRRELPPRRPDSGEDPHGRSVGGRSESGSPRRQEREDNLR
jgi:GNAT superfamily N-acetyltransferase